MTTMTNKRVKKELPELLTDDSAQAAMKDFADASSEIKGLEADLELEISTLRARYAERIKPHEERRKQTFLQLERYSQTNYEGLFAHAKSYELPHGTIGYRKGTPQVVKPRGVTWATILEKLKAFNLPFVRTKEEVDKQAILAARGNKRQMEELDRMGISIEQRDSFYCEAKEEESPHPHA